jgi:hypothetical protein
VCVCAIEAWGIACFGLLCVLIPFLSISVPSFEENALA